MLPRRWVVERSFGWLVKHRRLVRDYENPPDHHEAMAYIASIHGLIRRLARTIDQHICADRRRRISAHDDFKSF